MKHLNITRWRSRKYLGKPVSFLFGGSCTCPLWAKYVPANALPSTTRTSQNPNTAFLPAPGPGCCCSRSVLFGNSGYGRRWWRGHGVQSTVGFKGWEWPAKHRVAHPDICPLMCCPQLLSTVPQSWEKPLHSVDFKTEGLSRRPRIPNMFCVLV